MYIYNKHETISRAKKLIGENTPSSLRYACLELRYCIEAICFEKLKLYEKHIPKSAYEKWQPKKIVTFLQEYNHSVIENYEMALWTEKPDGALDKLAFAGKHTNLPFTILKKHYSKIGRQLHLLSLSQQQNSKDRDLDIKSYLESILSDIEAASSNTFDSNIGGVAYFTCKECDHVIVRNIESIKKNPIVACINDNCDAEYEVTLNQKGSSWKLKELDFDCPKCRIKNYFSKHYLKDYQIIECCKCSTRYEFIRQWCFKEVEENKT